MFRIPPKGKVYLSGQVYLHKSGFFFMSGDTKFGMDWYGLPKGSEDPSKLKIVSVIPKLTIRKKLHVPWEYPCMEGSQNTLADCVDKLAMEKMVCNLPSMTTRVKPKYSRPCNLSSDAESYSQDFLSTWSLSTFDLMTLLDPSSCPMPCTEHEYTM